MKLIIMSPIKLIELERRNSLKMKLNTCEFGIILQTCLHDTEPSTSIKLIRICEMKRAFPTIRMSADHTVSCMFIYQRLSFGVMIKRLGTFTLFFIKCKIKMQTHRTKNYEQISVR